MIQFGMFFWGLDQGVEALRFMRDLNQRLPPRDHAGHRGVNAPPAPFVPGAVPAAARLRVGARSGSAARAARRGRSDEVRASCPPLFEFVTPMPFTALQQMFDEANCWGQHYYEKSAYIAEITDDVIDVVTEHVPAQDLAAVGDAVVPARRRLYTEAAEDDTAFGGGRTPRLRRLHHRGRAGTRDAARRTGVGAGVRRRAAPAPIDDTTYVNADDRVRRGAGAGLVRGGEVRTARRRSRAVYDPGNVFHRNINIKPA